ncbi:MAG: Bcr/CflA family multidrug efflux MFS transporter [Magnetospirillum sp.]|nr:Bcr/CflA family multidrug efflux MFS transporter [Magnetospirillum sp.]
MNPTPSPEKPRLHSWWLVLLGIFTATGPLSMDMYLPSFPLVEKALGAQPGSMEFTLASFFIGLTLGMLFYGPVSDRFGRKKPLYFGFFLYTTAALGCALSDSITAIGLWRFIQGIGGCAGIMMPSAIVRDRLPAQESARALSMLMLVMGLAPIVAPLLGGWILTLWGWRVIFIVLAAFGGFCLTTALLALSESHDTEHEPPLRLGSVLGNYRYLLTNRTFLGFAMSTGLTWSGMFAYLAGSPFVLIDLHGIRPDHYGWYFGVNAFGLIASSQINAYMLRAHTPTEILRRALWIPPIVGIFMFILSYGELIPLPWVLVGFFLFVSSVGWIAPNAMASLLATHGQMAGTAASLAGAMQFLFATIAGALVGTFNNGTDQPLAMVMAACGLGAWLSHRTLIGLPHPKRPGA